MAYVPERADGDMTAERGAYQRLPGVGGSGLLRSRTEAWLGPDHLLLVEGVYTERYRRVDLADIQAISYATTPGALRGTLALLTGAALMFGGGLLPIAYGATPGEVLWLQAFTLLLVIAAGVNAARGPSCRFLLKTGVQTIEVPSLRRVWKADKVYEILSNRVEAVQGAVSTPEAPTRLSGHFAAHPELLRAPALRVSRARLHLLAYAAILASAAIGAIDLAVPVDAILTVAGMAGLAGAVLLLAAVADQRGSTVPPSLRALTWWALGAQAVSFVLSVAAGVAIVVMQIEPGTPPDPGMFETIPPEYRQPLNLLGLLFDLPFALPGLFMTLSYRRKLRGPAPDAQATP